MEWRATARPVSDIMDWTRAHRLELQPNYQRNEAWSKAAQIALIDTILCNIPMPKIYVKAFIQKKQTYRVVIDGQQRLAAIFAFVENRLNLKTPYISFPEYDGKKFADLPEDAKNQVLSYNIDFNEIFNLNETDERELFNRNNKYVIQLNKQELRRADFPGEFITLAEKLSDLEFFADNKFFSSGQKRRMLDVEYVEELLALLLEGEQDKKIALDEFCEKYATFPQGVDAVQKDFTNIINYIDSVFSEGKSLLETRFKQKADFYSLFGCFLDFKKKGKAIIADAPPKVRESLYQLDELINPHSEDEACRDYAIHCISDANSGASRRWRKDFLHDYIKPLYLAADEMETKEE